MLDQKYLYMKYDSMTVLVLDALQVSTSVQPHKTLGLILAKIRYNTGRLPRLFQTVQLQFVICFSLFLLRLSCFSMLLRSHYINLCMCVIV